MHLSLRSHDTNPERLQLFLRLQSQGDHPPKVASGKAVANLQGKDHAPSLSSQAHRYQDWGVCNV